ncbi:hypothetical protein A4X13_0g4739 [Tilletia indica]|uniref:Uncharacterized protein n=1 Tax=Tilletia indica TaxID=43049 RepID=A0A177TNU4_9BASI|nr:hypothetical protein A4X13_0g4739 [Tilletia indica]
MNPKSTSASPEMSSNSNSGHRYSTRSSALSVFTLQLSPDASGDEVEVEAEVEVSTVPSTKGDEESVVDLPAASSTKHEGGPSTSGYRLRKDAPLSFKRRSISYSEYIARNRRPSRPQKKTHGRPDQAKEQAAEEAAVENE